MSLRIIFALAFAFACLRPVSAAIIIQGYSNATNNRFTNDPSLISNPFNLSGIGQSGVSQWGTLISPNVIVSANHYAPSGSITFYPNNDPGSTPVVRQITANAQRVGASDVWLAQLDSPVDTSIIIPFAYATEILTGSSNANLGQNDPVLLASAGSFQGTDAYLFGLSPAGGPATQTQAVGRNILTAFAKEVPANGLTDSLVFSIDNGHGFEATFQGGDSGAPAFANVNGSLVLLGVNSYVFGTLAAPTGNAVAYIGNYATSVETFIINAIPEPTSFGCIALVMLGAVLSRRRI